MILIREIKILWQKILYDDNKKSVLKKWKQSITAILVALSLSSILIIMKGQNPFYIFTAIIEGATRNPESLNETLINYAMFLLTGLAIIIAFRVQLFNIGVSGQMIIAGITMMIVAKETGWHWLILLLIGMLVAGTAAGFIGMLKAIFNIHEVVSCILINWIFFYVSQYLLSPSMSWTDDYGQIKINTDISKMQIGQSVVLPALLIAVFLLVSAMIFFKTTTRGFALKTVGQNQNAAQYAGIKVKYQLVIGMALSGLVAGALAGIYYLGKLAAMTKAPAPSLPAIGFQGIAVALIAFKSFIGLIPAAFFWAVLNSGVDYASVIYPDIPSEVLQLVNGFIIYMIAISIIFIRFKPLKMLWLLYLRMTSAAIKAERIKLKKAQQVQYTLFKNYCDKIQKTNQTKIYQKIKKLKLQSKKLLKKIKLHQSIFLRNKSKIDTIKLYEQYEDMIFQIKSLEKTLTSQLLKKSRNEYKNGLEIINNEYHQRWKIIQSNHIKDSIIGLWKTNYSINKYKASFFEEKYNLFKLELKENLKKIKINNKQKKSAIKNQFYNNINKVKMINFQQLKKQQQDHKIKVEFNNEIKKLHLSLAKDLKKINVNYKQKINEIKMQFDNNIKNLQLSINKFDDIIQKLQLQLQEDLKNLKLQALAKKLHKAAYHKIKNKFYDSIRYLKIESEVTKTVQGSK